jgi:hypothetical protein
MKKIWIFPSLAITAFGVALLLNAADTPAVTFMDHDKMADALAKGGAVARTSDYLVSGLFWLFSGCRSKIQTSAVEVNRVNEILLVAKSASGVLDPLDLGIDGLAGGVGDSVS